MPPIQWIQPPRTAGQEFSEGMSPYLQMAFQTMMQRKMEEQTRQRSMQQAQQMGLISTTTPEQYTQSMGQGVKPSSYQLTQQPGFQTSMKLSETGIPQFGKETTPPMQPTYLYNPSTGQVEPLTLPSGEPISPKSKVITKPESPEAKQTREVETAQAKKAEEAKSQIQEIDNMVENIFDAANRLIPAVESPKQAEALGIKRGLGAASIMGVRPQRLIGLSDENVIAYNEIMKAEATPVIRAMGEKGMLTNQDIQRALGLFAKNSDSIQLRKTRKEELSNFLKSKIKAYYKAGVEPTQQPQLTDPLGLR